MANEQRLYHQIFFLMTILSTICFNIIHANRVSDKIYSNVQSNHYCSRRLNATNQMGCQSELGGNTGVVWIADSQADFDHVLVKGPTPPYMVVLKREHFTRKNLISFNHRPDRVAGVVFLDVNHNDSKLRSMPFSPEDRCPNRYSGLYMNDSIYGQCSKNLWLPESPISGLLYDDISYPIFMIDEARSIEEIETCFKENNLVKGDEKSQDTYPLCSLQLDSFMLATINSKTCLNSRSLMDEFFQSSGQRCYTVGNSNIFAYFKPAIGPLETVDNSTKYLKPAIVEPQTVVMLATKLSSLSMFTEVSPGADSTITAIVTMIAVAEALGKFRNASEVLESNRNIAFAILDSEPFDYTGSSRLVYNMNNNTFPLMSYYRIPKTDSMKNINLESIDYLINIDQLASYPNAQTIYLHPDPENSNNEKFDKISRILKQTASNEGVDLKQVDKQLPLPPTSVQEFIKTSRKLEKDKKLLGLVLTNYDKTYNNLFYNGIYDDSHNIYRNSKEKLVEHLTKVSSFLAKISYELAFKTKLKSEFKVDSDLISNLLDCYIKDADCSTFTKAWQAGQKLPKGEVQTYKNPTKLSDDMNGAITANLLAYFIGDKLSHMNLTQCYLENEKSLTFNYQYVNGKGEPITDETSGLCIRSQVSMADSTSPSYAVTEDGITVDQNYPAWTVSLNNIRNPARLFIKSSPVHQWSVFLIGVVITLIAFVTVHHIRGSISQLKLESETRPGTST